MSRNPNSKAHFEYVKVVTQVNEISLDLDQRIKRCNYLYSRFSELKSINPEQAEAYAARINQHKPHIIEAKRKISHLKDLLDQMPRRGIS